MSKFIRKWYEKTGSLGHLVVHYLLASFVISTVSIPLNVLVWDGFPQVTPYEAVVMVTIVNVSNMQYRVKILTRKIKESLHKGTKS